MIKHRSSMLPQPHSRRGEASAATIVTIVVLVCLGLLIYAIYPRGIDLTGAWRGHAYNQTVDLSAPMQMQLRRLDDNMVEGDLMITGALTGGSTFSGVLHGGMLSFVTTRDGTKIMWTGTVTKDAIKGSYTVEVIDGALRERGLRDQQGVWVVERAEP